MATPANTLAGTALGILENAPDLETGYQWLTSEYQDQEWDDPVAAARTMTEYGTALRQKFKQNYFPVGSPDSFTELDSETPFKLAELPDPDVEDPEERALAKIDLWEQSNLRYLDQTLESDYSLNRELLARSIPEVASRERRKIKDPGFVRDFAARVALGVVTPITSLFDREVPQFLQENTSVDRDDDFLSELASGVGTVGTAIGVGAATGGLGVAGYLGAGAVGATKNTYLDIKEQTGSTEQAAEAALVEAGGQAVGFALGGRVASRLGSRLAKATASAVGKSSAAIAEGATTQRGKEIVKAGLTNFFQQGAANVAMRAGSNLAQRVGLEDENIAVGEGLLQSFAVGGILGVGATGFTEGYAGLAERSRARRVKRDLEGLREEPKRPPPPGSTPGEIVEPGANAEVVSRQEAPKSRIQGETAAERIENYRQYFSSTGERPTNREIVEHIRDQYDDAVARGDREQADFLLGSMRRVAENRDISEPPEIYEIEDMDAAEMEMAVDLPDIDQNGIAHPKSETVKFAPLSSPDQYLDPAQADQTLRTADGVEYDFFEDGRVTKTNADTSTIAPADKTFAVDQDVAVAVTSLKNVKTPDGKTPQLRTDGEDLQIVSDYVTSDLDVSDVPTGERVVTVPVKETAGIGDVLVQASVPLTGGERIQYASNVSNTIAEVVPKVPPPADEPGPTGGKTLPRMVAKRIAENPLLPPDDYTQILPDGTRTTTLRYVQQPMPELRGLADDWIVAQGGNEAAIRKLIEGPRIPESEEAGRAGLTLLARVGRGITEANKAQDFDASARLSRIASDLNKKLSIAGTSGGRFINILKDLQTLDPDAALGLKIGELTERFYGEELRREGVTPEQAKVQETEIKGIDDDVARIQSAAREKKVELTEFEKTELADTEKALTPLEDTLAERTEKLNEADRRQIDLNEKEITRTLTAGDERAQDVTKRINRLNELESKAQLREKTEDLAQRIDELEEQGFFKELDPDEKARMNEYKKELRTLTRQRERIARAREKLFKAQEQRARPVEKDMKRVDKLNEEITELTKGLQLRSEKPESSLKPKDQERLERLRERRAVLKAKSEAKGEKVLSAEQAREIDKLLRRREQLKNKIENRTKAVEERLRKAFPDEAREQYKKLVGARNQLPEGDALNRANRVLTEMERNLVLSGYEKGKAKWFSFYVSNVLFDLGTALATTFGNTAQFLSGSAGVIAGGVFRGQPITDIPRNFQEYTSQVLKDTPKAFRAAYDAFSHNYFNKWNEQDFVTSGPPVLRYVGYSGRLLSALDVFYSTLGGDAVTAIRLLETTPGAQNLRGEAMRRFIADRLYGTVEAQRGAEVEAARQANILKEAGVEVSAENQRQIQENILRRGLNPDIFAEREAFQKKVSLTNDQYGAIGQMVSGLNRFAEIPGMKPFILFTRAIGNILALKLEHTPYGLLRPSLLKQAGAELTPLERSVMYTSALMGSAILASAAAASQAGYIKVHGNGPNNANERRRWLDSGAKPFSIQIGDNFVSYGESPFATMLAGLGGWEDYKRYSKAKGKISDNEAANYIVAASFQSLFANPLTQNAAQFLDILKEAGQGGDVTGMMTSFFRRNVVEAGRNALLPFNRQLRNVTAMFQDPLDTKLSLRAAVLNGIPFTDRLGDRPALNVFGKPIFDGKTPVERFRSISRFFTQKTNDPAIRFLTDKGYYVTDLPFNVRIPESLSGVGQRRGAKLGLEYADVLTSEERYELQRLSGPQIERVVLAFRNSYGHSKWDERIQEKLNDSVSKIRQAYRNQILGRSIQ